MHLEVMARATGWQSAALDGLDATLELAEFGFKTEVANLYRGTPLAR